MVKCDVNGDYIHPSMLRVGINKCQASNKLSEHGPSIVAFFITCLTRTSDSIHD